MNSCCPSRKRWYSAAIGSLTLTIRSAPAKTSSALATSFAPAAANSESENREPAPASVSTSTSWPACTSSATPSGCTDTRFSLSLISLGTPTTRFCTLHSSHLTITADAAGPITPLQPDLR